MSLPQLGDVIIKGTTENGFTLVEAITSNHLAGPFENFAVALVAARTRNARAIWQLSVDQRGRALGDPFRLPPHG